MLKIFVIYIVIGIIGNFLIKAFSIMCPTKLSNRNCITNLPTIECDLFNKNNINQWYSMEM